MRRRSFRGLWLFSGCLLSHSLDLGRTRRALRPLSLEKPRLSGHLQAQAMYQEDVEEKGRWEKEFQPFKDSLLLNRARNLVENTAREL